MKQKLFVLAVLIQLVCSTVLSISPVGAQTLKDQTQNTTSEAPDSKTLTQPQQQNLPNILFILTDDLDGNLGTMEYAPNIKKVLADQGIIIDDYFISTTLCCPSRSTTLRGQYTHNHQVYTNLPPTGGYEQFSELDHEKSTLATWLQSAGYQTVLIGKYLNGYPLKNDAKHIPPGWTEWYSPSGGNPYSSFNYQLNENGNIVSYGNKPEDYITDVISNKADNFIRRMAAKQAPFFAYVAPYAPHEPANPAPRHVNLYPTLKAPRTASFNETDVSDKPKAIRKKSSLTDKQIQSIDELYRKRVLSMQAVDEMVTRLVKTLDELGQLSNTYIIFTSDNGYHLGQHRLVSGKTTDYEEDIHVPFIIRGPGIPAGEFLHGYLVGNVDLAPTMAELAGIQPPSFVDGRSFVPLLSTSRPSVESWRQAYLVEQYPGNKKANNSDNTTLEPPDPDDLQKGNTTPVSSGLRTSKYKYVEYSNGDKELYDLKKDPYELDNQAKKADSSLLKFLSDLLHKLQTCASGNCREIETTTIQNKELSHE